MGYKQPIPTMEYKQPIPTVDSAVTKNFRK